MLANLKIENVAVIERAELDFERGLTILTGETGAGKSIIIDSINAILGERTSKDLVRTGAQSARVTAVFNDVSPKLRPLLDDFGVDFDDDGTVIIQRTVSADGRSTCRINGCTVTVSMLRSIGVELINIHGQHDSQALLNSDNHCGYIDLLAENAELLDDYKHLYADMRSLEKKIAALTTNEDERLRRQEFLKYQIDELEAAQLQVGEKEDLLHSRARWQDSEKIQQLLHNTYTALSGGEEFAGASGLIYDASRGLSELKKYFAELEDVHDSLNELMYVVDECSTRLSRLISSYEYDTVDIDAIEQRLDLIFRLSRKYGDTEEEMLAYLEKISAEYENLMFGDEQLEALAIELEKQKQLVFAKAAELTESRLNAAREFSAQVMSKLRKLDMPSLVLDVDVQSVQPGPDGADKVSFLISPNPGEAPKPLSKIASGGELSRIMLAIKTVLNGKDGIETMIFDEIDAGVSGSAAGRIAETLKDVSVNGQVICVTHLARIAAYADQHYFIDKVSDSVSTKTQVTLLDLDARKREIARIIGGEVITDLSLENANEMLVHALKYTTES